MSATTETPSPAARAAGPTPGGAGLGPHTHPVRDWSLPHQIILRRHPRFSTLTAVRCNCGCVLGARPAPDGDGMLRLYREHLARVGEA